MTQFFEGWFDLPFKKVFLSHKNHQFTMLHSSDPVLSEEEFDLSIPCFRALDYLGRHFRLHLLQMNFAFLKSRTLL